MGGYSLWPSRHECAVMDTPECITQYVPADRYCGCGHVMIVTEEAYSETLEEMVQFWECAYCHNVEEEVI